MDGAGAGAKRERKANFSDDEVRCLLEAIGEEKEVILSKLCNSVTIRTKKEAWGRVVRAVNACSKGGIRTEDDLKKKWKDLKSGALREQADQKKTGGGGPMKEVPFKELIFFIIGDRSDAVSGIEVDGTDSFVVPLDYEQAQAAGKGQEADSRQQQFQTLKLNDIETDTAVPSTSAAATSATVASARPPTSTSTDPEFLQPTTSAVRAAKSRKRARGGSARSGLDTDVSAAEESQLFNQWLSSEIEKNNTKIQLMKAKMELIESLKMESKLKIQKLQSETIVFSLEP